MVWMHQPVLYRNRSFIHFQRNFCLLQKRMPGSLAYHLFFWAQRQNDHIVEVNQYKLPLCRWQYDIYTLLDPGKSILLSDRHLYRPERPYREINVALSRSLHGIFICKRSHSAPIVGKSSWFRDNWCIHAVQISDKSSVRSQGPAYWNICRTVTNHLFLY